MTTARIALNDGTAICFETVEPSRLQAYKRVLLTLEGSTPGGCMNCALIPLDKLGAVVATLQLIEKQFT